MQNARMCHASATQQTFISEAPAHLTPLVVQASVKVPHPVLPEIPAGLRQEGRQLRLVQLPCSGVPALAEQLPHVIEGQLPAAQQASSQLWNSAVLPDIRSSRCGVQGPA